MVTPVSISPGAYGSAAATTIADTTTSAVTSGHKVVAVVFWYGSGSLSSLSGGGLTWNIQSSAGGTTHRVALATADAPSGLASSTTITATFSAAQDARGLRLASCDGLELDGSSGLDGIASESSANVTTWTGAITTTNATDVLFGAAWYDFYTGGLSATGGSTEIFDWTTADGSESHLVYKEVTSAGANSVDGSGGSNGRASASMAFKTAAGGGGASPGLVHDHTALIPPGRISPRGGMNAWRGSTGESTGTAYDQPTTDGTGLTDSIALDQGKAATDPTGLTDSTVIDRATVTTDPTGLTDSTALARSSVVDDSTGLADSATVSFVKDQSATDDTGLTDTVVVSRGYGVAQTDPTGLTDTLAVDRAQATTDSTGLTDSATPAVGIARTIDDTTGLTDSVSIDNGKVVTATDSAGLTDAQTMDRGQSATDTAGLTDSASLSLSRPVTDTSGLTDSVVVENGKTVAVSDTVGLTDTVVLQLFKAITDTAGMADLAALTRGLVTTDSTGLTDSVDVVLTGASVGTPVPERLVVGAESRTLVVASESRSLLVEAEDRRIVIPRENRTMEA